MTVPPAIDGLPEAPSRGVTLVLEHRFAAAPAEVWPHVSRAELLSAWSDVEIRPLSAGPGGGFEEAGATREVLIPSPLGPVRARELIVVADPPHRFVYHVYQGGGLRYHLGEITLTGADGGTHLHWTVRMTPRLPGTGWILLAVLRPQFTRGLATLERILEVGPVATSG
jgi:uncharacterized protein YndB with AHSA1/START domain